MLSNQSVAAILLPAMIAGTVATFINWRIHRDMIGVGWWPAGSAVSITGAREQSHLDIPNSQIRATVSAGLAVSAPGEMDYPRLSALADAALYRAKAGGRNRVEDFGTEDAHGPGSLEPATLGKS